MPLFSLLSSFAMFHLLLRHSAAIRALFAGAETDLPDAEAQDAVLAQGDADYKDNGGGAPW